MFRLTLSGNILSASQREKETEVQGGEESCLRHPVVSVSWGSVGHGGSLEGREAVVGISGRECSEARLGRHAEPHLHTSWMEVSGEHRGVHAGLGGLLPRSRAPLGGSVKGPRPAWKMPMHETRQPHRLWNKTGHLLCPPPPHKILIKLTGSYGHHQCLSFNSALMLKPLK